MATVPTLPDGTPVAVELFSTSILSNHKVRSKHERFVSVLTVQRVPFVIHDLASDPNAKSRWRRKAVIDPSIPGLLVHNEWRGTFEEFHEAVEFGELDLFLRIDKGRLAREAAAAGLETTEDCQAVSSDNASGTNQAVTAYPALAPEGSGARPEPDADETLFSLGLSDLKLSDADVDSLLAEVDAPRKPSQPKEPVYTIAGDRIASRTYVPSATAGVKPLRLPRMPSAPSGTPSPGAPSTRYNYSQNSSAALSAEAKAVIKPRRSQGGNVASAVKDGADLPTALSHVREQMDAHVVGREAADDLFASLGLEELSMTDAEAEAFLATGEIPETLARITTQEKRWTNVGDKARDEAAARDLAGRKRDLGFGSSPSASHSGRLSENARSFMGRSSSGSSMPLHSSSIPVSPSNHAEPESFADITSSPAVVSAQSPAPETGPSTSSSSATKEPPGLHYAEANRPLSTHASPHQPAKFGVRQSPSSQRLISSDPSESEGSSNFVDAQESLALTSPVVVAPEHGPSHRPSLVQKTSPVQPSTSAPTNHPTKLSGTTPSSLSTAKDDATLPGSPSQASPDMKTPDLKTPDLKTPDLKTPDLKTPPISTLPALEPTPSAGISTKAGGGEAEGGGEAVPVSVQAEAHEPGDTDALTPHASTPHVQDQPGQIPSASPPTHSPPALAAASHATDQTSPDFPSWNSVKPKLLCTETQERSPSGQADSAAAEEATSLPTTVSTPVPHSPSLPDSIPKEDAPSAVPSTPSADLDRLRKPSSIPSSNSKESLINLFPPRKNQTPLSPSASPGSVTTRVASNPTPLTKTASLTPNSNQSGENSVPNSPMHRSVSATLPASSSKVSLGSAPEKEQAPSADQRHHRTLSDILRMADDVIAGNDEGSEQLDPDPSLVDLF